MLIYLFVKAIFGLVKAIVYLPIAVIRAITGVC